MNSFHLIISFVLLSLGCHSTPLKAPHGPSPAGPSPAVESDIVWLKDYKAAREGQLTDPARSCATFQRLAVDPKFPGHDVAKLRAIETCPNEKSETFDRGQLPFWLQDLIIDVQLKQAAQMGDKNTEMLLAVEKSKQKIPQSEKVKWMTLALERAAALNLADKSSELTLRLYGIAPRLNPEPTEKQSLLVASDFRMARQFDQARAYYEKVIASKIFDTDDKIAALKGIRLTFKNARQNEAHLAAAARLIEFLKAAAHANPKSRSLLNAAFDAEIYHSRALWTLGRTSEAKALFGKLEKTMQGRASRAELFWLLGRMSEETKDFAAVSRYMDLALKEHFTDNDLRDKIFWYSAWNERRQNHLERAVTQLVEIDQKTQSDFTRQRALYWLGKTYFENHQDGEGKETLNRLIDLDPLGYYGLMAHRQLGQPITLQSSTPDEGSEGTGGIEFTLPMNTRTAEWLYLLEEKDALTAYLDQTSQLYRKQKDQTDAGWVQLFKYYAKAGLYVRLYASLGDLSPEQRKSIFARHPELLFPQPWNEDIRAASLQFGVDEELIYAIIRQESAFDPHARSPADAFGLMQLLPEVAEHLSDRYKIPYTGMEDLYDPKTNVAFGAAHLKELFQRHHGQFILAVASYNASENVIHTWMKTRFHGDALEFIEEIPYEETRAYVRLVMRNLIFYSLLKSKTASMDFPDRVLKLTE